MFSLIVGGAASGKSGHAENLVLSLAGQRVYVATMEPWDEECLARIERHRTRRAGYGFQTRECYRDLAALDVPADANVLLDCLGNLLANELYDSGGMVRDDRVKRTAEGVLRLRDRCRNLTVVSNEVCLAGTTYEGDTLPYLRALAHVNRALAAEADYVCEVVCGLPNVLKGGVPCMR